MQGAGEHLHIPEVVSHDADDESAEVIINDGWGVRWALLYRYWRRAGWCFEEGHMVPRGEKDPAARMVVDPPDDLIELGRSVLETVASDED